MSNFVTVNDNTFDEEILKSETPILVEFGAVWCGPCKRLAPILEQLAQEEPNLKIVLVDIDDSPEISSKMGIRSVPTLIVFKNGEKYNTLIGLQSLSKIKSIL